MTVQLGESGARADSLAVRARALHQLECLVFAFGLPVGVCQIEARSVAYPEHPFVGKVASIDSRVDPVSRSLAVRAVLPNESLYESLFISAGRGGWELAEPDEEAYIAIAGFHAIAAYLAAQ